MKQSRISLFANISLYNEVLLLNLFGLVHIWVKLTRAFLGEDGQYNLSVINNSVPNVQQLLIDQFGVSGGQYLKCQVVGLKQVKVS